MKNQPTGRIEIGGRGTGEFDEADLAKRAAEIARMDGRNGTNKADWTQAQEELQGISTSFPPESSEAVASVHDWNDPGSVGHRGHKNPLEDEYPAVESLINEGLEEADRDQRLEAVREEDEQ
jgi:hypothetical protein